MKVCLITSAAYIDTELAAEFGRLPPSFLPIGHQRLYELQVASIIKSLGCKTYLTVPKSFLISKSDQDWLDHQSVGVIFVPDGLSLAQSVLFSLECIHHRFDEISILHGDTLIEDIPIDKSDIVAMSEAPESYEWGFLSPNRNDQILEGPESKSLVMAGYFAFQDSSLLKKALSQEGLTFPECIASYDCVRSLHRHLIYSWLDFGHLQTFYRSRCQVSTQRAFNELSINYQSVIKTSNHSQKIRNEANWFDSILPQLRLFTPALLGMHMESPVSYSLEYLPYPTLHELFIFGQLKRSNWDSILASCFDFMGQCTQFPYEDNSVDLPLNFLLSEKSSIRLQIFLESSNISLDAKWAYEGNTLPSIGEMLDITKNKIDLKTTQYLGVMHGDLCFTNIFYNFRSHRIQVIDPRGSFNDSHQSIYGDIRYDMAKLAHSIIGGYDYILTNRFKCTGFDEKNLSIVFPDDANIQFLKDISKNYKICSMRLDDEEIMAIMFHLFISMLPLHADRPERQHAFLANALRLFSLEFA